MQIMIYNYFFVVICLFVVAPVCDGVNNNNNKQYSATQDCRHSMTYSQIVLLLSKTSCLLIENDDRTKRNVDSGSLDLKALQTTINDHRAMIEYLFKNIINESVLADALHNHSRIGPSLTSWRDLVDLFSVGLVVIKLIYLFMCRVGFSLCDKLVAFLFRPVLDRLQQKRYDQQQQQQQETLQLPQVRLNTISGHTKPFSMFADGTQ
jgi:hypothetical protein